ncbi:MAG TPA: hypothetical protein VD994_06550 [Prosthecobacter sp.]|nr:hypothetical protein [Prosthecobacter sp.]
MKTFLRVCALLSISASALLVSCDGKPSPPDATSAGMEENSAPVGRPKFGESSGQGVQPQNLGTSPSPPER